jgi:hypothetical protein
MYFLTVNDVGGINRAYSAVSSLLKKPEGNQHKYLVQIKTALIAFLHEL